MAIIEKPLPSHGNLVFSVIDGPDDEPITTEEVKDYAKIDTDADDDFIDSVIVSVRQTAEKWLGRALMEQTIESYMDFWPDNPVKLPRPPLITVSSITTLDEEGNETLYSVDNYFVKTIGHGPGQIIIKSGAAPPINTDRCFAGYKVVHINGYGDQTTDVPSAIRTGLLEWVTYVIENRIVPRDPPDMAMAFLSAYRIMKI